MLHLHRLSAVGVGTCSSTWLCCTNRLYPAGVETCSSTRRCCTTTVALRLTLTRGVHDGCTAPEPLLSGWLRTVQLKTVAPHLNRLSPVGAGTRSSTLLYCTLTISLRLASKRAVQYCCTAHQPCLSGWCWSVQFNTVILPPPQPSLSSWAGNVKLENVVLHRHRLSQVGVGACSSTMLYCTSAASLMLSLKWAVQSACTAPQPSISCLALKRGVQSCCVAPLPYISRWLWHVQFTTAVPHFNRLSQVVVTACSLVRLCHA